MALPKLGGIPKSLKWMAACAVLVAGFEGLSTTAYHDDLAHGLPTVCYGETEGVHMGDHYTKAQCIDMLANKLPRYWREIEPAIHVPLSDNEKIAYTSFAYNLGSGAVINSKFIEKLNAGDHKGACEGMIGYSHAKGIYVPGLKKRRIKEIKVCETIDLPGPADLVIPLKHTEELVVTPEHGADPYACYKSSAALAKAEGVICPVEPQDRLKPHVVAPIKPALVCTQFLFWRTCK